MAGLWDTRQVLRFGFGKRKSRIVHGILPSKCTHRLGQTIAANQDDGAARFIILVVDNHADLCRARLMSGVLSVWTKFVHRCAFRRKSRLIRRKLL